MVYLITLILLVPYVVYSSNNSFTDTSDILKLESKDVMTWQNRRFHTMSLFVPKNQVLEDKWFTLKMYPQYTSASQLPSITYNWNVKKRLAFTYLDFKNEPLGPETVKLKITTNMFEMPNVTTPLPTSIDYMKFTFKFNRSHLIQWINGKLAIKLFLRDMPIDLGSSKKLEFGGNFDTSGSTYFVIYYWDPTVFCWDGPACYDDLLPNKYHFDPSNFNKTKDQFKECRIVNCTHEMLHVAEGPTSEFARCVRLYHTPPESKKQRVLLSCANENYTYTACETYRNKPCWYEVCDNYDLCNGVSSLWSSLPLLSLLVLSSAALL